MGYRMVDKEFDKLWDKFDTDGFHAISSEKFLKRLTNDEPIDKTPSIPASEAQYQQSAILRASHMKSSHSDSPSIKTPRNQLDENQIRSWLIHKFPQGFAELERAFEQLDTKQMGTVKINLMHFFRFN